MDILSVKNIYIYLHIDIKVKKISIMKKIVIFIKLLTLYFFADTLN